MAIPSPLHPSVIIAENAKHIPESVKAYNDTNYSADTANRIARK